MQNPQTPRPSGSRSSGRPRIGIDGRYQGQSLTGIPRYIDELCKQLDVLMPEAEFFVYAMQADGIRLPSSRWHLRVEPFPALTRLKPNLWWKFFAFRLIRRDQLDVLWACANFIPFWIGRLKTVYVVYDLTFKLFPETMSRTHVWAFRLFFKRDVRRADRVIAISQGTSDRLFQHFKRRADSIVRPDASPQFSPQSVERIAQVKAQYQLDRPFLLAVSTLEPRKNLLGLIDAFLKLKHEGKIEQHELVLIGKKGWRNAAIDQRLALMEAQHIRWLGYVPDKDLPALYSGCQLFCMPSLYEGFGMPAAEALSSGSAVAVSDIPELREATNNSALYFNPSNLENISKVILEGLQSGSSPKNNAAGGTWYFSAQMLVEQLNRK